MTEKKERNVFFELIGKVTFVTPILIVVVAALILWKAFVGKVLWGWFISPIFNLPELSVLQMYGVMMVISLLFKKHSLTTKYLEDKKTGVDKAKEFLYPPVATGVALLIGYFIHRIM